MASTFAVFFSRLPHISPIRIRVRVLCGRGGEESFNSTHLHCFAKCARLLLLSFHATALFWDGVFQKSWTGQTYADYQTDSLTDGRTVGRSVASGRDSMKINCKKPQTLMSTNVSHSSCAGWLVAWLDDWLAGWLQHLDDKATPLLLIKITLCIIHSWSLLNCWWRLWL